MRRSWLSSVLALALALSACGDGGGPAAPPVDAGAADAATEPATRPTPPAPPVLEPCAGGWTAHEVRPGITACDPGAATTACSAGEAWLPGGAGCAPIGHACPADGWPAELRAAPNVRFVKSGSASGDGATHETAFGTIGEALAGAPPGTVIGVAVGAYAESLTLGAGIELRGACASGTRIGVATSDPSTPVIYVHGRDTALVDVGVVPSGSIGVTVEAGSARIDGVSIEGASAFGFAALNADITGRGLLVRDVAALPDGTFGTGFAVLRTSHITLDDVVIERASGAGLDVDGPTQATLGTLAIRDTQPNQSGHNGRGAQAQHGAQLELAHAELSGSKQAGLIVLDPMSRAVVSDSVIRDTASRVSDGSGGAGIVVFDGSVELTRVHVLGSRAQGLIAGMNATLVAHDLIVEGTRDSANGAGLGIAIAATPGATLTIARALLVDSWSSGIVTGGGAGSFEDISVVGALDTEGSGVGIGLGNGGNYTVRRALVDAVASEGVIVTGTPAEVTLEDLLVRDVRPRADGSFGRGLEANGGVTVHVARARFERTHELAVLAFGAQTRLDATDLAIVDTAERACAATTCAGFGGGTGLGSYDTAVLNVTRFLVQSAALCGAQLASGGALDLTTGQLRGAAIGACVQVPGYDLTRLTNGVLFEDNGVNIDTADVYVPEPVTDLVF